MALQILAVLLLGLMCGSELNVAAFAHPNPQPPIPGSTHSHAFVICRTVW